MVFQGSSNRGAVTGMAAFMERFPEFISVLTREQLTQILDC